MKRLDSHRVATETQTNPRLARAFKHAAPAAPDSVRERIAVWHNARTSLTKIRVQLLGEIDTLVHDLPEDLRPQLRLAETVSARVNSLRRLDTSGVTDPTVALRLRLIQRGVAMLREALEHDKAATAELTRLVDEANATLTELVDIAPSAAAEIIVEVATSAASPKPASPVSTALHRSRRARAKGERARPTSPLPRWQQNASTPPSVGSR